MKLFKKSLLTASLLAFAAQADIVNRKQARNYIEHVIATLFDTTSHHGKYADQLDQWTEDITYELLASKSARYSTDAIYSSILERAVELIEDKAAYYTQKELANSGYYGNSYASDNILQKISQEVDDIINGSSTLKQGALANYFGAPLKAKVQKMAEKHGKHVYKKNKTKYVYKHKKHYVPVYRPVKVVTPVIPVYQPVYAPVVPNFCISHSCAPRFGFGFSVRLA